MLSRKINAVVSLFSTAFLLGHAIYHSVRMLSGGKITLAVDFMPWILAGLMLIHAFISIDLAISAHMEGEKRKCKSYPKMNVPTIIQRASGVIMIPVTLLHIAGTTGFLQPPEFIHAILPPLFFTIALMHAAVSTGKAFVTLGIGNAKLVKAVDIAIKLICGVTLLAAITGFYLYTFVGVGI